MNRVHRAKVHCIHTALILLDSSVFVETLLFSVIFQRSREGLVLLTRNNRRRHRGYSKRRHYRRRCCSHSQYCVHRCYCPCLSLFAGESADIAEFCCSGQAPHPGDDESRRWGPIAHVGYENHDGLRENSYFRNPTSATRDWQSFEGGRGKGDADVPYLRVPKLLAPFPIAWEQPRCRHSNLCVYQQRR